MVTCCEFAFFSTLLTISEDIFSTLLTRSDEICLSDSRCNATQEHKLQMFQITNQIGNVSQMFEIKLEMFQVTKNLIENISGDKLPKVPP